MGNSDDIPDHAQNLDELTVDILTVSSFLIYYSLTFNASVIFEKVIDYMI